MKQILLLLFILCSIRVNAQTDTIKNLNEITVKGYYNPQPLLRAVGSVSLLDSNQFKNHPTSSLLSIINTAPGARMEERSPGSYRLSLRGSLLRSPFGIRNIKIYLNDFPFTDAGGNTYLNSLDASAIAGMEIYKGPEASIFGANTGGAVLISTPLVNLNKVVLGLTAGSFGFIHQTASVNQVFKNYKFNVTQGYQQSDGYRANSALKRKYIQTEHVWNYNPTGELKSFIFYSDLNYQTPGGLNAAQLAENPKAARPATSTLPGAITQQAAIYNQTFFGGLSNNFQINANLKHVLALFTSYTDFKNPFITNYEKRIESTIGLRTFLEYVKSEEKLKYNFQAGVESSGTKTNIKNFKNDKGSAGSLTAYDDLHANQTFAFIRFNFDVNERLLIELGSSLNFYNYAYQSFFPLNVNEKERKFDASLMPKLATSYLIHPNFTIKASASKGYSAPTLAEVRSSDQIINTNLRAEAGWNYETGFRFQTTTRRVYLDATLFYFNLKDAIVRRLNDNDVEFFINAGGTKQLGTELQVASWLIAPNTSGFLNGLQLRNSYTYSRFRFDNFQSATANFSGNRLTGVPSQTVISSLLINFKNSFYVFAQHNFTSEIPVNDANTVFANRYHLVDLKAGLNHLKIGQTAVAVYLGINNLFNQRYSLGNDLNAASNRYFNPAAGFNFNFGITVGF